MSGILRHFSDFTELVELGFDATLTGEGVDISRGGQVVSRISNPFVGHEVDPAKYLTLLCFTGHVGEGQTAQIKLRGADQSSLGYVFPLSALRTGAYVEGDWPRRYAWVAVNALLAGTDLEGMVGALSAETLRSEDLLLDDIFLSYLSVAVFGLSNLAKHSIPTAPLHLMMMSEGVRFPSAPALFGDRPPLREWSGTMSCSAISQEAMADVETLTVLIRLADEFDSSVGVFLTRYQVVEHWLSKLFGVAVSGSYFDDPDPWTLKNRLTRVSGDRWRLAKLDTLALGNVNRSRLNELGVRCRAFLSAVLGEPSPDDAWWKSLYAVRNVIVHDQARFVVGGFHNLDAVNEALRDTCLELLTCFSAPQPAEFWAVDDDGA